MIQEFIVGYILFRIAEAILRKIYYYIITNE